MTVDLAAGAMPTYQVKTTMKTEAVQDAVALDVQSVKTLEMIG